MKSYNRFYLPLFFTLLMSATAAFAAPKVVVSIKPLHSLVAGVMQGVGEPELLIKGGQSPHSFSLAPSDARKLSEADMVVWVGERLETPLAKSLHALSEKAVVVELIDAPGMQRVNERESDAWEKHNHDHEDEAHGDHTDDMREEHEHEHKAENHGEHEHKAEVHDEHDHEEGHHGEHLYVDPHIWMSPVNAVQVVRLVAEHLAEVDTGSADRYRENAKALVVRLEQLDRELAAQLAPVKDAPYVVFHDAYRLFEERYGLNAVGSVTVSPERSPGARHVHQIREKIEHLNARCVFSEPQFQPKMVQTLIEGTKAKAGQLDPLGAELEADSEAYFTLLRNLAQSLVSCLDN